LDEPDTVTTSQNLKDRSASINPRAQTPTSPTPSSSNAVAVPDLSCSTSTALTLHPPTAPCKPAPPQPAPPGFRPQRGNPRRKNKWQPALFPADHLCSSLLGSSFLGSSFLEHSLHNSCNSSSRLGVFRGSALLDVVVSEARNSSTKYVSRCGLLFAQHIVQFKGVGCVMTLSSVHRACF